MCRSPSTIWVPRGPRYEAQQVRCNHCPACRFLRVNDYSGRALAEAEFSLATVCLTLTYAPGAEFSAERFLHPPHFQSFVRALRRAGHVVRYLVAGEYGELRQRCHFHAILFFKSQPPDWPHKNIFHIEQWPHGHVFADWSADARAVRYVTKYLFKGDPASFWFSLSKKPSLGSAFFLDKAQRDASIGALPHTFQYRPPGGDPAQRYYIRGATRRDYLDALLDRLEIRQDKLRLRFNQWVSASVDKLDLWRRRRVLASADLASEIAAFELEIAEQSFLQDREFRRRLSSANVRKLAHYEAQLIEESRLCLSAPRRGVVRDRLSQPELMNSHRRFIGLRESV